MCGISGFIDHLHCVNESTFKKASAALRHRGGNGSGIIYEEKEHFTLGIANERLATIDLSAKAQQPLTSNCGNYSITLNGTIFNYVELRETLIKYGIIFSTLSDTEVVLESYKKWGNKAFEKLDGSFALAILDRKLSLLLVVSDEIGAKPLYFYKKKGFYAFASEVRAILEFPFIEKKINREALATYLRYGYFLDDTIYQDIFRFKKGTITTIDIHSGNSYDMPILRPVATKGVKNQTEDEILAKIEELLTESILKRNLADVPTGALLSSGYDSSTVAAILQKNQSKRIKTFTVGFAKEKIDEAPQAKKIAAHLKTNHEEFYLDKHEALKIVKNLPQIFDEPIGNSGAVPSVFIASKVHREIKVLLGAEGGDELFGGYRTYIKALELDAFSKKQLPAFIKKVMTSFMVRNRPQVEEALAAEGLIQRYLSVNACFTLEELEKLIHANPTLPISKKNTARTIKELLLFDLHHYLPNNILHKNDRSAAHFGMENRDAMLKNELVDYINTLDHEWFIKDGQQKYLLKKITRRYIPSHLLEKPKKGFTIPLTAWLKTAFKPLVEKYLSPQYLDQHQLFNAQEVARIKSEFFKRNTAYNAQKVWLLLQFQMWYEHWMNGASNPGPKG